MISCAANPPKYAHKVGNCVMHVKETTAINFLVSSDEEISLSKVSIFSNTFLYVSMLQGYIDEIDGFISSKAFNIK